jgi:RNA:NAD 2'-phosphotransferase (TPT1/KptA family)
LRKVGNIIGFGLAQREGDWLKLGVDLQEHICNIFGLGEAERQGFYRQQRRRHKDNRGAALLHQQTLLMDHLAWLLWWKGKEIRILLDAEGWQSIADLAKKFAMLNREMNR